MTLHYATEEGTPRTYNFAKMHVNWIYMEMLKHELLIVQVDCDDDDYDDESDNYPSLYSFLEYAGGKYIATLEIRNLVKVRMCR